MISAIRNHWNDLDWRDEATCRDLDPELFFPVGVTGMAVEQIEAAKSFCRVCPSHRASEFFYVFSDQDRRRFLNTKKKFRCIKTEVSNISTLSPLSPCY